ncbi:MAG TPA: hypothetical protein VHT02_01750 [Methylocella sp.]|nr:hypothetical protein [Methylocella sp.]
MKRLRLASQRGTAARLGIRQESASQPASERGQEASRYALFMEFLYPVPLSTLESLCAAPDMGARITSLEHLQAKPQSVRREIAPVQQRQCLRDKKFMALVRQPAMHQKDHPMPVFFLDLIYVAIGVAAFAITALYLSACDSL